ncbi:hypothetical protein Q5752_004621 [Cryptotrichosporon argae]
MSTSATPQSAVAAAVLAEPRIVQFLRQIKVYLGALITVGFLSGIAASVVLDTSLDTSALSPSPSRTYFAMSSNIFNQLFVKRCWGWTSLFFLLHLLSAPPSPAALHEPASSSPLETLSTASPTASSSRRLVTRLAPPLAPRQTRRQRLAAFVLSSSLWVLFTSWFFGASLGDRIIALSGGRCAVALPTSSALDPSALDSLLPTGGSLITGPHDSLYLPLPATLCYTRAALSPTTHPELFRLLAPSSLVASPTTAATLPRLTARWAGGFDVSGHAFLLTLSALVLAHELAPSWAAYLVPSAPRSHMRQTTAAAFRRAVHGFATVTGTALVGLWVFMLGVTAVFFHNPPEKISGLALGLSAAFLVDVLTPRTLSTPVIQIIPPSADLSRSASSASASSASRKGSSNASPVLASPIEDDENSARRGLLDDDVRPKRE